VEMNSTMYLREKPLCSHDDEEDFSFSCNPEQIIKQYPELIPKHVAIIPDGNRRWAAAQEKSPNAGHKHGADIIIDTVKAAKEIGIKVVTLYVFSTENWLRSPEEIAGLMWLIENYLIEQKDQMIENGICFNTIGNLTKVPESLQKTIEEVREATAHLNDVNLVLAVNYGGRDEITRAVRSYLDESIKKGITPDQIKEEDISRFMDTAKWGDPDLLIRTGGEKRISNFMLWQISYTEIRTIDVLWPDFTPAHLYNAVLHYQTCERRLGR